MISYPALAWIVSVSRVSFEKEQDTGLTEMRELGGEEIEMFEESYTKPLTTHVVEVILSIEFRIDHLRPHALGYVYMKETLGNVFTYTRCAPISLAFN
jgi:hypothetical protein